MKNIVAVVAGYALWTALWLGGNAALFGGAATAVEAGQRYDAPGPLAGVIGLSLVCSLAAGLVCASIARARGPVLVMALLLLATGIFVQAGVWELMPAWYHLTFLALIVPVALLGSRFAGAPRLAPA